MYCYRHLLLAAMVLSLAIFSAHADAADVERLTIVSGNAAPGQLDPYISVAGAPVTIGGISYPAAPVSLQQASVLTRYSAWATPVTGSQWIGVSGQWTNSHGGYIYETVFTMPDEFYEPVFDITWAADDRAGVYLNQILVAEFYGHDSFTELRSHSESNLDMITPGLNLLQIHVANTPLHDTPTGVTFAADIHYVVPEPSSIIALTGGLGALLAFRRRRK